MYIINWSQTFGDAYIGGQLVVQPIGSPVQMNVTNTYWNTTVWTAWIEVNASWANVDWNLTVTWADGWVLRIASLAGAWDRAIWVDSSGAIIELTGGGGGTNFTVEDGLAQTLNVIDNTTLQITGRPGSVIQTVFDTPENLQVRIEWGSPGQVVWYDSDFGAGWVNGILTYSEIITPIANSPLVITHNWWTTSVQVSVYDTATGEEVVPETISRDSNAVRITMSVAFEIEIVIIWFIPLI